MKDFVFIDDRADERNMITQELPGLIAIDPCNELTWNLFATWSDLLGNDASADRTKLYQQRAEREKMISSSEGEQNPAEMFRKLRLRISITKSTPGDLKRVHELINRTNQWNLNGTRCAYKDVVFWHESPSHVVYTVRVSDKFGSMGVICCCVAEFIEQHLDIRVFVLSCRVFGYGVETLLIEQLKKDALERFGAPNLRGTIIETPNNKPCRTMYADHGFHNVEGIWVYSGDESSASAPIWFTVESGPLDAA